MRSMLQMYGECALATNFRREVCGSRLLLTAQHPAFIPFDVSMTLPTAPAEHDTPTTVAEQVTAFDGFTIMRTVLGTCPFSVLMLNPRGDTVGRLRGNHDQRIPTE